MEYQVDGSTFVLNYQELRDDYFKFKNMSDADFMKSLVKALHFACIVLYLKEAGPEITVSDKAIIHELVHLLDIPEEPLIDLQEIRKLFNEVLYLA
jgi:hypothetical protein